MISPSEEGLLSLDSPCLLISPSTSNTTGCLRNTGFRALEHHGRCFIKDLKSSKGVDTILRIGHLLPATTTHDGDYTTIDKNLDEKIVLTQNVFQYITGIERARVCEPLLSRPQAAPVALQTLPQNRSNSVPHPAFDDPASRFGVPEAWIYPARPASGGLGRHTPSDYSPWKQLLNSSSDFFSLLLCLPELSGSCGTS